MWFKEGPSQFSKGQTAQSLTCSIMKKSHTGGMNVQESYSRALEQGPLELAAAAIDISISSSAVNYGRDGRNFRERGRAHHQHEFWVSFSEAVSATNEGSHGVFEPKLGW